MLQGPDRAMVAGLDSLEVAADLPGTEDNPLLGESLVELPTGPGSLLGEQASQLLGHPVEVDGVRDGSRAKRVQRVEAAGQERLEDVANGLAAHTQVDGDPRGRPARVGEEDDLDTVTDPWRDRVPPQGLEFITGCVVNWCANYTEL